MGSAVSAVRTRRRFYKYGSDYFDQVIMPNCRELIDEIELSHADAKILLHKFVSMDADGSGNVSVSEFHRYFGWKRGAFTERIFDTYAALTTKSGHQPQTIQDDDELSYEELLVCVWNYASYDVRLMAQFIFNIFDIDGIQTLSIDECDAMLRMVHHNQNTHSCDDAMKVLLGVCETSSVTLESFIDLVVTNNAVVQPAFDIQLRIIEKTTGDKKTVDGKGCWELYRERRREKFGDAEIPKIKYNGTSISSAQLVSTEETCQEQLSDGFISTLFHRVERNLNAPAGFDSRLEEERYVDKLRDALENVEATLLYEDFCIERVEERKELRKKLWGLIDEIKRAHVDALSAELERDVGIWNRSSNSDHILEYSSTEEMHDCFDQRVQSFNDNWDTFVDSYETRLGPATTKWERLYDPDQHLSVYFQWQTGERCYNQQVGNQPPAICEVCDHLLALSDYKCFNCDAPRSERNKKKYRGRVSLETMEAS